VEEPDPRQQVLSDLATEIEGRILEGDEIILMCDSNESVLDKNSKILEFFTKLGLNTLHTNTTELPSTYDRGHRCIYYILLVQQAL
jgi:hypothetical protein